MITDSHVNDPTLTLERRDYDFILGFYILEILIPNGQRPGVIQGIFASEVYAAETDIATAYLSLNTKPEQYSQRQYSFISKSSLSYCSICDSSCRNSQYTRMDLRC